ncbi:MAG: hypothetical protein IJI24_05970 [Lachnospiraceae bacterium]|nr:hypothetical protein [Lachnospiraceae bacterium]
MLMNIGGFVCCMVVVGMMVLAKVCMKPVEKEEKDSGQNGGKTGGKKK